MKQIPSSTEDKDFYLQFDDWSSSDSGFHIKENEKLEKIRNQLVSKNSKRISKNKESKPQHKI